LKRFARRRSVSIPRRFIVSLLFLLLALLVAVPGLADFLGPDRTTSQFVTVRDPDNDVWTIYRNPSSSQGPSFCLIIHPCDEHPSVDRQKAVCGWDMGGVNSGCSMAYKTEEQIVTLAEATISDNLQNCNLNNGWCTSSPTLQLAANEPLPGETITLIEGTRNGEAFACTSDTCDVPLVEGSNSMSFWALSSYGDGSQMGNLSVQVDTVPPSSAFGSPPEGSSVWVSGVLNMSGSSSDASSGVANAEISLNGGSSWQALAGGSWSYSWDTSGVPDGSYSVLVRARDVAGHLESTAGITVHVDHTPPLAGLPDEWLIWEPISIGASDSGSGVDSVELTIHGASLGVRKYKWSGGSLPGSFVWDRFFGSMAAPIGRYKVTLEVWDALGNSSSVSGTVVIPAPPTAEPEPTSAPPTDPPPSSTPHLTATSGAAGFILIATATSEPPGVGSSTGSGGGPAAAPGEGSVPPAVAPPGDAGAQATLGDAESIRPSADGSTSLLWGSAALAAAAAATAYAVSRRKARELQIEQMRQQIAQEQSPSTFARRLERLRAAAQARIPTQMLNALVTPLKGALIAAAAVAGAASQRVLQRLRRRLPEGELSAARSAYPRAPDQTTAEHQRVTTPDTPLSKLTGSAQAAAGVPLVKLTGGYGSSAGSMAPTPWWQKALSGVAAAKDRVVEAAKNLASSPLVRYGLPVGLAVAAGSNLVQWGNNVANDPDTFTAANQAAASEFVQLAQVYPEVLDDRATRRASWVSQPYRAVSRGTALLEAVTQSAAYYVDAAWQRNPIIQSVAPALREAAHDSCPNRWGEAWWRRCAGVAYGAASIIENPADTTLGAANGLVVHPVEGAVKFLAFGAENNPIRLAGDMVGAIRQSGLDGAIDTVGNYLHRFSAMTADPEVQSGLWTGALLLLLAVPPLAAAATAIKFAPIVQTLGQAVRVGLPTAIAGQAAKEAVNIDQAMQAAPDRKAAMEIPTSSRVRTFVVSTTLILTLLLGVPAAKRASQWFRSRGGISPEVVAALEKLPVAERAAVIDAAAQLGLKDAQVIRYFETMTRLPSEATLLLEELPALERLRLVSASNELLAQSGGNYQYHILQAEGPLLRRYSNSFGLSQYSEFVLDQDIVLFRAASLYLESQKGGHFGLGRSLSFEPPLSEAAARIDSAIRRYWIDPRTGGYSGQSPIDSAFAIRIPKGTTVYVGPVGYQGEIYLGGPSRIQVVIPDIMSLQGVEVIGNWRIP